MAHKNFGIKPQCCDEAKQFFNELIELWNKRSEILNVRKDSI